MNPIDVVLLIRNEIEREGLRRLLADQSLTISSCHADHASIDLDQHLDDEGSSPIIIIDLGTSAANLDACRHVRARWPHSKVVFFTSECDSRSVADALDAGADGFVAKHNLVSSLGKKLMLVALGEKIIPADVILELSTQRFDHPRPVGAGNGELAEVNLSERELQILGCLVRGDANKVISRGMNIAEATVKVHVKAILRKLSVANRTQAAIWGMSRGVGGMPDVGTAATPIGALAAQAKAQPSEHAF